MQLLHEEKQLNERVYKELIANRSSQALLPCCYHTQVTKCAPRLLSEGYPSAPRWV